MSYQNVNNNQSANATVFDHSFQRNLSSLYIYMMCTHASILGPRVMPRCFGAQNKGHKGGAMRASKYQEGGTNITGNPSVAKGQTCTSTHCHRLGDETLFFKCRLHVAF